MTPVVGTARASAHDAARGASGGAGSGVTTSSSASPAAPAPAPATKPLPAAPRANPALMLIPSTVVCPGEKERPPSPPRVADAPRPSTQPAFSGGGRAYTSRGGRQPQQWEQNLPPPQRSRSRSHSSGRSAHSEPATAVPPTTALPGWLPSRTRGRHPNIQWLAAPEEALLCVVLVPLWPFELPSAAPASDASSSAPPHQLPPRAHPSPAAPTLVSCPCSRRASSSSGGTPATASSASTQTSGCAPPGKHLAAAGTFLLAGATHRVSASDRVPAGRAAPGPPHHVDRPRGCWGQGARDRKSVV